ncbi:hypothetical protein ACA910_014562 [Epithemia clementina (nom. ined.)]
MTDNWDDSDNEWDADDDELEKRLGLKKVEEALPTFDEEDLTLKEKAAQEAQQHDELKKKGTALMAKKEAEKRRLEEIAIAKKAMEVEAEAEANLSPEELKALKQKQIEEADNAITDDLFGGDGDAKGGKAGDAGSGDALVLTDVKDHLKHALRVSEAFKKHGKIHLATAFIKEVLEQSKSLLDDPAISDIIKTCNVIKNDKVQAAKRKVKGQPSKAKKVDKAAEIKARTIQVETFGDNDKYDNYDQMGADYEDAFF